MDASEDPSHKADPKQLCRFAADVTSLAVHGFSTAPNRPTASTEADQSRLGRDRTGRWITICVAPPPEWLVGPSVFETVERLAQFEVGGPVVVEDSGIGIEDSRAAVPGCDQCL